MENKKAELTDDGFKLISRSASQTDLGLVLRTVEAMEFKYYGCQILVTEYLQGRDNL